MAMQKIEVSISEKTAKEKNAKITEFAFEYDLPTTIKEAVSRYSEEPCLRAMLAKWTIDLQGVARTAMLKEDATKNSVAKAVQEHDLSAVRAKGKSKAEKIREHMAALSPEERKALLRDLAKAA